MKKKESACRGSLTVFAAISFMLIAQLLFVLAEGCRQTEMIKVAEMNTDSVAESFMAGYCRPMWEDYHLLANDVGGDGSSIDLEYMREEFMLQSEANFDTSGGLGISGYNLLSPCIQETDFSQYTLLTDGQGKAYIQLVSAYMKDNLVYEEAKKIYNNYEAMKNVREKGDKIQTSSSGQNQSYRKKGGTYLLTAQTTTVTPVAEDTAAAEEAQSMLKEVTEKKSADVLSLVIPEGKSVSESTVTLSELVSQRTLAQGKNPDADSASWYDSVLLQQYLLSYFSCFTEGSEDDDESEDNDESPALEYEIEYLLAGKSSDRANLKTVLLELLAVREAANLLYLSGDSTKTEEAEAMAAGIAALLLSPELEETIKGVILTAWAFCESVLDLRALLDGKRITLLKTEETWTTSLQHMATSLGSNSESLSSSKGLDYKDYLGLLLFTKSSGVLAMRAMDMQEKSIQKKDGYQNFQMDHCICDLTAEMTYSYESIFYSFVYLISADGGNISISEETSYSYLKKKDKSG